MKGLVDRPKVWEQFRLATQGTIKKEVMRSIKATKGKVMGPLTGSATLEGRKEHLPRCLVDGKEPFPPSFRQMSASNYPSELELSSSDMLVACEQPTNICPGPISPSRYVTTMDARSQEPIGLVQPRCAPCSVQPPACLLEPALFAAIVTTQSSSPTGTFPMLRILSPPTVDGRLRCSRRHKHGGQAAVGNST